jgi:N-acetylmuramoyl-L-alanine amidase
LSKKRVLIQAGHVAPREPGFESGTGTVREQELSLALQSRLARRLLADGRFDVTRCPGDIPNGWTGDLFISLHGDGSGSAKTSGFSFGFPPGSAESARFAALVKREFERIPGYPEHRKDNYTGNLTGYYGWRRTNAPAKVLIEHGFLTNPNERAFLFSHLAEIALAEYRATLAYFGYPVTPKPREPVIVNMPLEETIAMLKKTPAYKRGWRRMVELVQRYESMRKK